VTPGRATDFALDGADRITSQTDHGTQPACSDDQQIQYSYLATSDLQDRTISRAASTCTDTAPGWTVKQQTANTYFLDGSAKTIQNWNGPAATATLMQSHTLAYEDANGRYLWPTSLATGEASSCSKRQRRVQPICNPDVHAQGRNCVMRPERNRQKRPCKED
jgi:predicted phage gp36 major capsid-like protein